MTLLLANAYLHQRTGAGVDDDRYMIMTPEKNVIGYLPKCMTEQEAMSALRFARDYEAKGFQRGVLHGRGDALLSNLKTQDVTQITDKEV